MSYKKKYTPLTDIMKSKISYIDKKTLFVPGCKHIFFLL